MKTQVEASFFSGDRYADIEGNWEHEGYRLPESQ